MFSLFHAWRRRKLLRREIPQTWWRWIQRSFPQVDTLEKEERNRFLEHLKIAVWEKNWVGAQGFSLREEHQVIIATQAARMGRALPHSIFDGVAEWVIYEDDFVIPDDGFEDVPTQGQALPFGTVVLSWASILEGLDYPCLGFNPILHELAHILDLSNGYFDGTPLLHSGKDYSSWQRVLGQHFEAIRMRPEESFLDLYGANDEAEFFAVATEAFFEFPEEFKARAPDLFAELARYYRLSPLPNQRGCDCDGHCEEEEDSGPMEEVGMPLFQPKLTDY